MSAYELVLKRISEAAGTRPVTLVAVSKTQSADAVEELYWLGQRDFGENYAQELLEKAGELERRGCAGIRWHMIGHLQTNKVKSLMGVVACVHTVDSEKLGAEIAKRAREPVPVFIEVNIDSEDSKSGVSPEATPELARKLAATPELILQGLMAVPAPGHSTEAFRELTQLEKSCRPHTRGFLSMGMSGDFEEAIRQGATHVRVGTALFGQRASK